MSRAQRIKDILSQALAPSVLEIEDESQGHSGHRTETHFKVLIVSEFFQGLSRLDRQRKLNDLLKSEFENGLHALTQRALSPQEFADKKDALDFISPECRGGSKGKGMS